MNKSELAENKIKSQDEIKKLSEAMRLQGKKIVFTNGCFDILHLGHIDYLLKASDLGDFLVVGLNSDASVKKIKGDTRPINDEISRSKVLASLFFIDAVVLFSEETPYNLIKIIEPDILVKGKDYKISEIVGSDIVIANGGKVETIDLVEGYSTSAIEERIIKSKKNNF